MPTCLIFFKAICLFINECLFILKISTIKKKKIFSAFFSKKVNKGMLKFGTKRNNFEMKQSDQFLKFFVPIKKKKKSFHIIEIFLLLNM